MSEPFTIERIGGAQRVPLAVLPGRVANAGGRAEQVRTGLWRDRSD